MDMRVWTPVSSELAGATTTTYQWTSERYQPGKFSLSYVYIDGISVRVNAGSTISVKRNGDEYEFMFDMVSDNSKTFTGTWTGKLGIYY